MAVMKFKTYVQIKNEKGISEIARVSVENTTIVIDRAIKVRKESIRKIQQNDYNNSVIVHLKRPSLFIGSFLSFDFNKASKKQMFIRAIGEIETDERWDNSKQLNCIYDNSCSDENGHITP